MDVTEDPVQRAASKMAGSMNLDPLDEGDAIGAKATEKMFNVHWLDEETEERLSVAVEVQSHTIVLDVILAGINSLNEKLSKEKRKFGFQLAKDPSLYSLMLADEDMEPEEPGKLQSKKRSRIVSRSIRSTLVVSLTCSSSK